MSKEYNTDELYVGTLIIFIKTNHAIAKLKDALAKNQCSIAGIKAVVLQYKNANEQSMIELAAFLEANPKITSCYYETDRVDLFAKLVLQTNTTIEKLCFTEGFSINIDDAEALSKALQHNKTLQYINLESVTIEDQGLSKVFQGLKENATITSLSVENIKIQQNAVDALSTVLQDNSSLTTLSLRNCQVTDDLLSNLVDNGLKKNSTIESLLFIHNKISAVGAEKLAEFLQGNNILKRFFISDNRVGDDGVIAIARELKENNTLKELGLSGNKIGYKGIAALSEALHGNNILEKLDLGYNNVDDQAVEVLVHKVLSGNVTLQSLSIESDCLTPPISKSVIGFLAKVLPNTGIYYLTLDKSHREINDILEQNRQKLDAQKEAAEKAETPANIHGDVSDGSPAALSTNDVAAEEGSDQVDLTGNQHPLGEF